MSRSALAARVRQLRGTIAAQRHHDESDEQLLHAFLVRRDESAFTALVRRHGPMVMGVCRRVLGHQQDAEDAFQANFLVLARRADALRDKTALASFLHGIAHRLALRTKRAAARRRKHEHQASVRSTDSLRISCCGARCRHCSTKRLPVCRIFTAGCSSSAVWKISAGPRRRFAWG